MPALFSASACGGLIIALATVGCKRWSGGNVDPALRINRRGFIANLRRVPRDDIEHGGHWRAALEVLYA
jgi:hypothetical protein